MIARGLPARSRMENPSGVTSTGDPYLRVFLTEGVLRPGQSIVMALQFRQPAHPQRAIYSLGVLSGHGTP